MSYQTEEEQLAVIGQLWKKYGNKIIAIIVIIAIIFYAYRAWNNHQKSRAQEASALYQQLVQISNSSQNGHTLNKTQADSFKHIVSLFKKDFPDNIYAQYAELLQAKQAMDSNKPEEAKAALRSVIKSTNDNKLKTLATIRLATILTGEGEKGATSALDTLKGIKAKNAFAISYEEAMGDAYLELKQTTNASTSYQKALTIAKQEGSPRPLIQIKLDNLAQPKEPQK